MTSSKDHNFMASSIIDAPPNDLWKAIDRGRLSSLWNDSPLSFQHGKNSTEVALDFNCQGLKTHLNGTCLASNSTSSSKHAISWKGRLLNGRDGFIDTEIILTVQEVKELNNSLRKNRQKPMIKTKISLSLAIEQMGGRIALLDRRITQNFWQKLVDSSALSIKKKAQAINIKPPNKLKRKKIFIRTLFIILLIFATIVFFTA